jgi:hypothetical protein
MKPIVGNSFRITINKQALQKWSQDHEVSLGIQCKPQKNQVGVWFLLEADKKI